MYRGIKPYLLVRVVCRLRAEDMTHSALSTPLMSSAAGGTRALGRHHIGAGHAGVGATSVDDLVGLHGAAAPFEARFTVYEVAAERVMGSPTAGSSSAACAWQRMGIGPALHGSDFRRAFIHYNNGCGGIEHCDARRAPRQRVLPEDVLR